MQNLVFVLCLLFVTTAIGQSPIEKAELPLEYRVSIYKTPGKDDSIGISIRVFNTSRNDIVIDKTALYYRVTFERKGEPMPNGGIGQSEAKTITADPSPDHLGEFTILKPGQSFREKRQFSVGSDFFKKNRSFALVLTYGYFRDDRFNGIPVWKGSVDSNSLVFYKNF